MLNDVKYLKIFCSTLLLSLSLLYSLDLDQIEREFKQQGLLIPNIEKLDRYLQKEPKDFDAKRVLCHLYITHKDYTKAKLIFEELKIVYNQDDQIDFFEASILGGLEDFEQAIEICNRILNRNNRYLPVWILLTDIYIKQEKYSLALSVYQKIKLFYPNNSEYLMSYTYYLILVKDIESAEQTVRKIPPSYQNHHYLSYLKSSISFYKGNYKNAQKYIQYALFHQSHNTKYQNWLNQIHLKQGQFQAVIDYYTTNEFENSREKAYQFYMLAMLWGQKNKTLSQKDYQKMISYLYRSYQAQPTWEYSRLFAESLLFENQTLDHPMKKEIYRYYTNRVSNLTHDNSLETLQGLWNYIFLFKDIYYPDTFSFARKLHKNNKFFSAKKIYQYIITNNLNKEFEAKVYLERMNKAIVQTYQHQFKLKALKEDKQLIKKKVIFFFPRLESQMTSFMEIAFWRALQLYFKQSTIFFNPIYSIGEIESTRLSTPHDYYLIINLFENNNIKYNSINTKINQNSLKKMKITLSLFDRDGKITRESFSYYKTYPVLSSFNSIRSFLKRHIEKQGSIIYKNKQWNNDILICDLGLDEVKKDDVLTLYSFNQKNSIGEAIVFQVEENFSLIELKTPSLISSIYLNDRVVLK